MKLLKFRINKVDFPNMFPYINFCRIGLILLVLDLDDNLINLLVHIANSGSDMCCSIDRNS